MSKPTAPTFKDQLLANLIRATSEEDFRNIYIDTQMLKAMEVGGAGQERPAAEMSDRVVDQSIAPMRGKAPGKEEIKMGPTQAASGGNAERQISQYSDPAEQQDITVQYEKLSGMLGSMGKAVAEMAESQKALAATFAALLKKADDEEEGEQEVNIGAEQAEDEEETGKSLTPAFRAYFRTMKADLLAKADEEDEEEEQEINIAVEQDEEGEEEAGKALRPDSLLGMAKAIFLAAKAAAGETKVAKAARPRLRKLVEKAIRRAWGMAKKADGAKDAPKLASEIAEYAFLKGFSLKAPAKKADATGEITKDDKEHQQTKWATSGKAEVVPDDVLKGMAVLNGNMASIMEALSGKGVSLPATPLGLISKAAGSSPDGAPTGPVLFKSALASEPLFKSWRDAKFAQLAAAEDTGELDLVDTLGAQTILQNASAVQAGLMTQAAFAARVNVANEKIRALFADVLEG